MLTFRTIITIAILGVLYLTHQTDAKCCGFHPEYCIFRQDDTTRGIHNNTMMKLCCGVGDCNVFCCNCDGGCLWNSKEDI